MTTRAIARLFMVVGAGLALPAGAGELEGSGLKLDLAEWVGDWTASEEQSISITMPDKKGLLIEGFATYGALDPDRVERGAVNMGEFSLRLPGSWIDDDNAVEFAIGIEGEAAPASAAGEYDCVISMRLDFNVNWIDVTDNRMCGGMNVSFTGQYQPAGD